MATSFYMGYRVLTPNFMQIFGNWIIMFFSVEQGQGFVGGGIILFIYSFFFMVDWGRGSHGMHGHWHNVFIFDCWLAP